MQSESPAGHGLVDAGDDDREASGSRAAENPDSVVSDAIARLKAFFCDSMSLSAESIALSIDAAALRKERLTAS